MKASNDLLENANKTLPRITLRDPENPIQVGPNRSIKNPTGKQDIFNKETVIVSIKLSLSLCLLHSGIGEFSFGKPFDTLRHRWE